VGGGHDLFPVVIEERMVLEAEEMLAGDTIGMMVRRCGQDAGMFVLVDPPVTAWLK
jgi:hypothetical protein